MDNYYQNIKRIVVKLGTQVVISGSGPSVALDRLAQIVTDVYKLQAQRVEVVIVSSGAVGLGRKILRVERGEFDREKESCAAVGQCRLMEIYRELFEYVGLTVAQVLLPAHDLGKLWCQESIRSTLETLLAQRVVPIINENDVVAMPGQYGDQAVPSYDNDTLAAHVAVTINADLLILLTNVKGVYTANPLLRPEASVVRELKTQEQVGGVCADGVSLGSRGGMRSKLGATLMASARGIPSIITSGLISRPLRAALERECGTLIHPNLANELIDSE